MGKGQRVGGLRGGGLPAKRDAGELVEGLT